MNVVGMVVVVSLASGVASADNEYLAGISFRTDRDTQLTRLSAGIARGPWAVRVLLDPIGYSRPLQQDDTDVAIEREVFRGWAVMAGWRVTTTPIAGHRYWNHRPFVGFAAPLTTRLFDRINMTFGGEVAATVFKHGDELPTTMTLERHALSWGLFLRAEIVGGL